MTSFLLSRIRRLARRFRRARRGNVTMTFALATIPIIGMVGAAVDYSRASSARAAMQAALDSAGLILSREAQTLSSTQLSTKALAVFNANFHRPEVKNIVVTPTFTTLASGSYQLQLSASGFVETTFTGIWQPTVTIGAQSQVLWGMKRLELALALDNTGSMSSNNKMTQLKAAAKDLLKTLQNAAKKPEDVKIAIVPFATDVNIGTSNVNATWIRWTEWEAQPPALQSNKPSDWSDIGPGSDCPFTNSNPYRFRCLSGPNSGTTVSRIPSSGSYKGYICPSPDNNGTVYNGCYESEAKETTVDSGRNASCGNRPNCSCSGSGRNTVCKQTTYEHPWKPNNHNTWNGCVWDRDQDHDVKNTATSAAVPATLYSAHQAKDCPVAMLPLTNSWSTLNNRIDQMQPVGNTNVTIGLQVAFQALSPAAPFNAANPQTDLDKVIILLTDGDNTESRFSTNKNSIDARTKLACDNAKAANVKLYTIRVINGNSGLLQQCATKADMYYDVQNANQLSTVFSTIAQNLANLRLSK